MDVPKKIRVGISVGDTNGIGIEIILKTFADKRMFDFCTPVIYASNKTITTHKSFIKSTIAIQRIHSIDKIIHGKLNLIQAWNEDNPIEIGKATKQGGHFAFVSLEKAVLDLKQEKIDVLVTAPINKQTIQSDAFNFPGHTEYLESKLEGNALMILMSGSLKVALLTGHIPIHKVSETITPELIHKKINLLYHTLREDFSINKPKIAVLSINPHAGDQGLIGKEDETIMKPSIENLQKEGKLVYGPYAADSFFGSNTYRGFDAVMAAYHDQGLTAFKTLAFGKGVNYTAGLDSIRTSPDHGTAFDIAGKNIADPSSFKEAVFTAISIYKTRLQNKELKAHALS